VAVSVAALALKGRALRYLATREYSRAELARKLAPLEQQPGQLAGLLDELQAKGLMSEQRVAESLLNRRAPRLGSVRLRHELEVRGLDAATVAPALESLQATEQERATQVWRKKFGQPPADASAQAKQIRFLVQRGFELEVARQTVRSNSRREKA